MKNSVLDRRRKGRRTQLEKKKLLLGIAGPPFCRGAQGSVPPYPPSQQHCIPLTHHTINKYMYIHIHPYIHPMYTHIHPVLPHPHTSVCTPTYIPTYTRTCRYPYVHSYMYASLYIHTYVHPHTPICPCIQPHTCNMYDSHYIHLNPAEVNIQKC